MRSRAIPRTHSTICSRCRCSATAFEHAETTQNIAEKPSHPPMSAALCFHLEPLHKIVANAGGAYVEIDTSGDPHYDATGLIRVHFAGCFTAAWGRAIRSSRIRFTRFPQAVRSPPTTGVGVAWQGTDGAWHTLGELVKADLKTVTVETRRRRPSAVSRFGSATRAICTASPRLRSVSSCHRAVSR